MDLTNRSIQYRMHPFISELPSKVFYNGQLRDGPDMPKKTAAVWHERNIFGPYRFFNVTGNEVRVGTSTRNPDEARVAVELYGRLEADFGSKVNLAMRIGVISMYREQLGELKRKFTEAYGPHILDTIEWVHTCVSNLRMLTKLGLIPSMGFKVKKKI